MSMSFDPASAAAAFASARELQALREMAEKDRDDVLIQGEMIMKISDLLIAQQAFAGNVHEDNFLLRFKAISAVSEITPARLKKVKSLQEDMVSLINSGYSISCRCSICVPLAAAKNEPKFVERLQIVEGQIEDKNKDLISKIQEITDYQDAVSELSQSQQNMYWSPIKSIFKISVAGFLVIYILVSTIFSPYAITKLMLSNPPKVGESITISGIRGTVESVGRNVDGSFKLVIRTPDGSQKFTSFGTEKQILSESSSLDWLNSLPFIWLIASILWILRIRSKVKKPKHFQQYVDDSISDNSTVRSLRAEIRILENEAANLKNSLVSVRVVGDPSNDYDDFDLILEDGGPKKIEVIKEIRALKGLELKEAKDLVEAAPILILSKVTERVAFAAKVNLEEVGAMVTIRPSTE